ncbi:Mur ligase [Phlebopus sp. FC_14]|nr:Mur ligase [Phlebopus sp. FC_14]
MAVTLLSPYNKLPMPASFPAFLRSRLSFVHYRHSFYSRTMSTRTYKDAVERLNSLQSNADTLAAARAAGPRLNPNAIPEMIEFLERIGYTCDDLNKLNVIHITGTKGKGSTSAFTDSILRHSRPYWKVGLYTSPHLVAVRERIRVGGEPLSEVDFAKFFFEVWDRLEKNGRKTPEYPVMPNYFRYLTLMAFHTFMSLSVDATILEVGIGGLGDSTNIVPKPIVTGITALGLDHTAVLGKTIREIATQKAGIYKPGVPALTVRQPVEGGEVLLVTARGLSLPTPFLVVDRRADLETVKLGLAGDHQVENASLAVQMADVFLRSKEKPLSEEEAKAIPETLPDAYVRGLVNTRWPGRCQTIPEPDGSPITWYLDGAHTTESLECCVRWFVTPGVGLPGTTDAEQPLRVLIFNCTSGRAGETFLRSILGNIAVELKKYANEEDAKTFFDHVVFCTNVTYADGNFKGDLTAVAMTSAEKELLKAQKDLRSAWLALVRDFPEDAVHVQPTIEDAVRLVRELSASRKIAVLVTGSLHLVGGVIEVAGLSSVAL